MRMPGQRRSQEPDEVGQRAGLFAESIRDGDMDLAWSMLSKETRGMRMGVWATRLSIDMQVAYRAAYDSNHPMRDSLLDDFRTTVLRLWPLEDLSDLAAAPTRYVDDAHAFVFLPFGVTDETVVQRSTLMSGLMIPMLYEDAQWQVDLPGWRFLDTSGAGGTGRNG